MGSNLLLHSAQEHQKKRKLKADGFPPFLCGDALPMAMMLWPAGNHTSKCFRPAQFSVRTAPEENKNQDEMPRSASRTLLNASVCSVEKSAFDPLTAALSAQCPDGQFQWAITSLPSQYL